MTIPANLQEFVISLLIRLAIDGSGCAHRLVAGAPVP